MRPIRYLLVHGDDTVTIDFGEYFWLNPPNLREYDERALDMFAAGGLTGRVYRVNLRETNDYVGKV